jgi:hypothetical protein
VEEQQFGGKIKREKSKKFTLLMLRYTGNNTIGWKSPFYQWQKRYLDQSFLLKYGHIHNEINQG